MNIVKIYRQFPTHEACIEHLETVRWGDTPKCPYCKSPKSSKMNGSKRYHCNTCNTSYSVTVRTIFHKTHLDLQKWFLAISLILNAKKGLSARQLARDIEVNKNTAWSMGMRIRRAMRENEDLLKGIVEMDETFVGGKPRRGSGIVHRRGRGTKKTPVIGMVERGGRVRARPSPRLTSRRLSNFVREHVDTKRAVMITDEFGGYVGLKKFVSHSTIDHKKWYVDGDIHTNSIESFWALLKRGLHGQFHKVSKKHLAKYVDEFCYRYNHRRDKDAFEHTLQRAVGVQA